MSSIPAAKERLADMAEFFEVATDPFIAESVCKEHAADLRWSLAELSRLEEENARLTGLINSPETDDFVRGVQLEAAHQVERWGAEHDTGKEPQDWFWLIGYLGGKALRAALAGDLFKAKHHTISTAAALANWHAQLSGNPTAMRPGVDAEARGFASLLSKGGADV